MPVWTPRLTLPWVVYSLFGMGVLFLCLGAPVTKSSGDAVEQAVRYDNRCPEDGSACEVDVVVEEAMEAPVYLYYRLTNFHQNHRRYVKSRSDPQLRGESVDSGDMRDCLPLRKYGDGEAPANATLDPLFLYPCGLVANSFFTDTFKATAVRRRRGGSGGFEPLAAGEYVETGVAWPTDVGKKFNPRAVSPAAFTSRSPNGFDLPRVDDEHFVVWMRSASEPDFDKLYARLPHTSLAAGDVLRVSVSSSYPTSFFDGTKSLVLSKTTWVGTRDPFLGPAFLFYAFVCWALAGGFLWRARYLDGERRSGVGADLPFSRPFDSGSAHASVLEADMTLPAAVPPRGSR